MIQKITRRQCLKQITLAAAASVFHVPRLFARGVEPQPVPSESEAAVIAEIAHQLMQQHGVPGLSVAIARHGQFVFQQGFGIANKETGDRVTVSSLFRIASISKPITATAIFTLIEQGRLGLDDLVFGEHGIFKFDYGQPCPERVSKITIHHLLTHTCGGWDNSGNGIDPMFYKPKWDHEQLITWAVNHQPLQYEPGTHYAYSNFGYCILGRVIEKLSRQSYAEFVKQNVLQKCGITDMQIAGNTLAERRADEVVYYGTKESPYDMNVTRMDSHGGWIATASDLVNFAMHVDGFNYIPNILLPATIKTMTTPTTAEPHYACGWNVNRIPNWWHTGSLPGTSTIMVRTASGLCWAALANIRGGFDLDAMMWRMVKAVPAWKA